GHRSQARPDAVEPSTPFDLASVTKPIVATTVARLVRKRQISLEAPLGDMLPEIRGTRSETVPLSLFMAHRAGLDAHRSLYLPLLRGEPVDRVTALREAADARRPECMDPPPMDGFAPVYSDLGYALLGEAVSRAAGAPLDELVEREVALPLGLDVGAATTWLRRDPHFAKHVAPTEAVAFRGGEIVGAVHDENAFALTGTRLSGHAGLFGTAESVARFGAAVLDAVSGRIPEWLMPSEIEPLVIPRPGGTLRAGFDGRSETGSSSGSVHGRNSFGHLGFTGTSLWCDPDQGLVTVILTNRVSPSRDNVEIRRVRPFLNDALCGVGNRLKEAG
ncbi:MAG TPA: serine hydrolase domain-containing protein, partial [Polyangiaceae bacterium]|nr:serine hydrolase domain-containing protein [Polyangiaceae bacterium]